MIRRYRLCQAMISLCRGALAGFVVVSSASAQAHQPWTGRGVPAPQVQSADSAQPDRRGATAGARAVTMVGLTVSDMERSVDFYTHVLDFEKTSDHAVGGPAYEAT